MGRSKLSNEKFRNQLQVRCGLKLLRAASATVTLLQSRGCGQESSTRGPRDMRSPELSMQSGKALRAGHRVNASELAGTADTAATVILAAAAILLLAKSHLRSRYLLRRRLRRIHDRSRRCVGADPRRTFSGRSGTAHVCGSHYLQPSEEQRRAARRSCRRTWDRRSRPPGHSVRCEDGFSDRCHCA
jgi:hypothetical protein